MPFVGEDQLFQDIDFDSRWDSEPNTPFHATIPHGLQCHNREDGTGNTQMFAVIAPNSMWQEKKITFEDITDERSQTLVFVELDLPNIKWMSPTDISLDNLLAILERDGRLPSPHPEGVLMSFADVSYRMIPHDAITPELLRALVSIDGGEMVSDSLEGTPH